MDLGLPLSSFSWGWLRGNPGLKSYFRLNVCIGQGAIWSEAVLCLHFHYFIVCVIFQFTLLHMLHHYRCATILAMSPADEASHSLWCPGGYICIYVCKNICIYIVDAETPGYLYFYSDYVCIRVTYRLSMYHEVFNQWSDNPPCGIFNYVTCVFSFTQSIGNSNTYILST